MHFGSPGHPPGRRAAMAGVLVLAIAMTASAQEREIDRALFAAVASGDLARIAALLREGAAVDARDRSGRTPLLVATRANKPPVARLLIAAGADVNAQDAQRDSPFLYAGAEGHLEILELTLAHGADLRSTNRYGGTALIPAAHHGHVDTVRRLLETAIDVDHVNNLGWTALLEAVILGDGGRVHTQIVALLLDAKADPNLADREGVTPLAHARRRGYVAMVTLLERAGAR